MKKIIIFAMVIIGMAFLSSCTENQRAKGWGGEANYDLKCGQKLIEVTWKGEDMWMLTRQMRDGEVAETYNFSEESSFGMMEGNVVIKECK